MPPLRPFAPRITQCLRASRQPHSRVPSSLYSNSQPTRSFTYARARLPRTSRPLRHLFLASAGIGVVYYAFISHRQPILLERPPSSRSPVSPTPDEQSPDPEKRDHIATGTSYVPFFPRTISLPISPSADPTTNSTATATLPYGTSTPSSPSKTSEEYTLLGLGIRRVSFLSIQVYVIGLYIATSDLPKLQESLVRAFFTSSSAGDSTVSAATTLVENEKNELRTLLSETAQGGRGEKMWDEVLRGSGVRSVLRIVPTRGTNFGHMRDGWVRSIDARSKPGIMGEKEKEGLAESVGDFKAIFGAGKSVGKGRELLLRRGVQGELGVWLEEDVAEKELRGERAWIGGLKDERISRLVWLGYLAGGNVASEEARKSVVSGVMDLVERPIGTIDTQVV